MAVSDNSILIDMVNQLRKHAIVVCHYMWRLPDQVQKSIDDHRVIINALASGDPANFKKINRAPILAAFEPYTGEKYFE